MIFYIYFKIVFNNRKLKEKGVKSYSINVVEYEKGRKIDNFSVRESLNEDEERQSRETNVFYNIDDCNEETCNIEITVRNDYNVGISKAFPKKQNDYSSRFSTRKMKNIIKYNCTVKGLPRIATIKEIELNKPIIII